MPEIERETGRRLEIVWDLSQERLFLAEACNQRFNFFLVLFGVIAAAAANSKDRFYHIASMVVGAVLCTLLYFVLRRGFAELRLVSRQLGENPTHPITVVRDALPGPDYSWVLSDCIPLVCIGVLILGIVLALTTSLTFSPTPSP